MITFMLAVCGNVDYVYSFPQSPPSRAAWIEIRYSRRISYCKLSPPSRAAWIEIILIYFSKPIAIVAAFTGGVD